jgi:regulatory protein
VGRAPRSRGSRKARSGEGPGIPPSAVELGIRYVTRRRRFEREVREHLRKKGVPTGEIEPGLARLRELGYVGDAETCRAWIRDRLKFAPRGRRLLRTELIRKGVGADVIDDALGELLGDEDEIVIALDVLRRSARRGRGARDDAARRRLWSALGRRGFPPEVCREALCRFLGEEGEDEEPPAG